MAAVLWIVIIAMIALLLPTIRVVQREPEALVLPEANLVGRDGAPEELGGCLIWISAPEEEFVPKEMQNTLVCGVVVYYAGPEAEARGPSSLSSNSL